MRKSQMIVPIRVVLLYAIFASTWIFLSDRLLSALFDDPGQIQQLQTVKGWIFVIATSLLLYALLGSELKLLLKLVSAIEDNAEEIRKLNEDLEQRVADRTARLEETNAALESFAYSVSHDLRTPLRAMQGFAEALQEDCAGGLGLEGQEYIERIVKAARRMDTLIQDLLAYSRLTRGDISIKPVSLVRVVDEALLQLEAEIREKKACILMDRPLPWVLGQHPILVQVVGNLLSNAIKFVPSEGEPLVRIWAEQAPGGHSDPRSPVRLWIQDHGIGIATEDHERIFQIFERLHGAEIYPGTGIGLAIARKGIERMGGRIGVESEPGQGSRFWVELPAWEDPSRPARA